MPSVLVTALDGPDRHDTGRGHPERPARMEAVERGIGDVPLGDALGREPARAATRDEIEAVHDPHYLDAIERFAAAGGGDLDPDTPVSPGSFAAALLAAGAGLVAVEALRDDRAESAFVAVRPPGHHATRARGQGFCLLNNVAVVAAALAGDGERVLVLDWDVHHGNGTQDIFWDDRARALRLDPPMAGVSGDRPRLGDRRTERTRPDGERPAATGRDR